jgi:hypothetical protein
MQHTPHAGWQPAHPAPAYPALAYPAPAHPAPAYPLPAHPPAAAAEYEFNDAEDSEIRRTAMLMRAAGVVSIVVGALQALASLAALAKTPLALVQTATAAVLIVVGIFVLRGGTRLAAVVETKGQDITHLMAGLHSVGTAFLVQIIAAAVGFVVGGVIGGLASTGAL